MEIYLFWDFLPMVEFCAHKKHPVYLLQEKL